MREKILIVVLVHIIGAVVTMFIHYKDGTFEWATKYGDGIRFADPSDVIFQDLFLWEINLMIFIMFSIEALINNIFDNKYKNTDDSHVSSKEDVNEK